MIGVASLAGMINIWRNKIKLRWSKAKEKADQKVNLIFKQPRIV